MIVETLSFDHQLSYVIVDYHQLSFSLNMFKIFMIVDDRFSRLTTCMIVRGKMSLCTTIDYHAPFDRGLTLKIGLPLKNFTKNVFTLKSSTVFSL